MKSLFQMEETDNAPVYYFIGVSAVRQVSRVMSGRMVGWSEPMEEWYLSWDPKDTSESNMGMSWGQHILGRKKNGQRKGLKIGTNLSTTTAASSLRGTAPSSIWNKLR